MAKVVLYSYFRSSCSYRVRIALALKNIDYEYKAVSLIKDGGEQHSEDYKAVNPMEQVPALVVNGDCLTDSLAIMEYLEEAHPETTRILPKDPIKRAQSRRLSQMIASGIQPIQNLSVLQKIGDEKKMDWGHYWIDLGFKALEKTLETTAGKYCVGDDITLADICLVPQVFNANRFKVDLLKFPTIKRIHDELILNEAFKTAHPFRQPDCPDDLKI